MVSSLNSLQLETFIHVADMGSFNKAAEDLYISPPAVIKQINALEKELNVALFIRTHRGLSLTNAGKSFYQDATYLLKYFNEAILRAQTASENKEQIIRIGTSPMTPGKFLVDLWPRIHSYLPKTKFQLIPFENTPKIAKEIQRAFEDKIDMVVGVLDENYLQQRGCSATFLSNEPVRIAVPFRHRLAAKAVLTLEDLKGEHLMVIHRNWNLYIDKVRDYLSAVHPEIYIETFDFYGTEAYNQCELNNHLIMTIEPWKDVHPLLKVIPMQWDFTIPFGILHARKPSKHVQALLDAIKQVTHHQ